MPAFQLGVLDERIAELSRHRAGPPHRATRHSAGPIGGRKKDVPLSLCECAASNHRCLITVEPPCGVHIQLGTPMNR
jgi:hypothetical protein